MFAGLILMTMTTGCSRFSTRRTPAFSGDLPTASEVVAAINRNAQRARGLVAKDLDISTNQVAVPLDGRLALELPRRFRMFVFTPVTGITVADIGSNDKEFWFYVAPPTQRASLVHCSYEDYGRVQSPLPFQPDWIFESLGLVPIAPDQNHLVQPGKRGTVELVTPTTTAQGQAATLITAVQPDSGIIVERRLEIPGQQQPIAKAVLSRHQRDAESGLVYPTSIAIDWPEQGMEMTIQMNRVEVNPQFDAYQSQEMWRLPYDKYVQAADAENIDLGAQARTRQPARPPVSRPNSGSRPLRTPGSRSSRFGS